MSTWSDPCLRDGPAHDFVPLNDGHKVYIRNRLIRAVCRKCGVYR